MKYDFLAKIKPGGFDFGSDYNRNRFLDWSKKNAGKRMGLTLITPESDKQRAFFEGGVIPLITFYQEGLNYRSSEDNRKVRDWVKEEFCPEWVSIGGVARKVAGSTKGKLQEALLEKVLDWMTDQGYQTELLLPADYKYWRDVIYSEGGPDTYIDYLLSIGKLRYPHGEEDMKE